MSDAPEFYRPTPGRTVGHWNVFPRGKPIRSTLDVAYADLPDEVKRYVDEYHERSNA